MCRSMVDIQCAAAAIRRGKKEEERRNHRMKTYWPALFHRAAIIIVHKMEYVSVRLRAWYLSVFEF